MKLVWKTAAIAGAASVAGALLTEAFITSRIPLIGAFAGLQLSYNPGIAFGLRLPGVIQEIIILIAFGLVAWMARTAKTPLMQSAFGLILGGGIANLIDRIPDGLVTDMFQVGSFPVFNVADSCITIGAGLLLLEMARRK